MKNKIIEIFQILYTDKSEACHDIYQMIDMIYEKYNFLKRNRKIWELKNICSRLGYTLDQIPKFKTEEILNVENADKYWQRFDEFFLEICRKIDCYLELIIPTDEIVFEMFFGIPPKIGVNLKPYTSRNYSFMIMSAVKDNWPEMLEIALTYEKNWPPKPPKMFCQVHSCSFRKQLIAELLNNAYEKALSFGYTKIIKILKQRIENGILIYSCCDRQDDRISLPISQHYF